MNKSHPTNPPDPDTGDSFSLEDSDDIVGVAKQIIDGHHIGVLTTVDEHGESHSRWMATLAFDEFPKIITLTSAHSRKVAQINRHPRVHWMFSNHDLTLILNLSGEARVTSDPGTIKRAWKNVKDKSRAFFLNNFNGKPVVIETTVDLIECTIPNSNFQLTEKVAAELPAPAGNASRSGIHRWRKISREDKFHGDKALT